MARDVANLLKPLINDSVSNESERLEVKLAAVIKDEVQKMQGAVIQSIIDLMGKSISANKGVGGKTTHVFHERAGQFHLLLLTMPQGKRPKTLRPRMTRQMRSQIRSRLIPQKLPHI